MSVNLGTIYAQVGLDMAKLDKGVSQAKAQFKKLENAGKKLTGVGKNLTRAVTAPIVGLAAAAVYTVAKFDDSMAKVQAISGATEGELGKLRDMAKELGSQTRYSASQAADAMGFLALAGWKTTQILAATPDMLNLAAAAGMELSRAADIVSDTMSAFRMEADRAGEAADIFAAASMNANTDVLQLGEAMKHAGAGASAAGMTLAQTATVLGVLADSGIKGSMAGTTFNAMLRDLRGAAEDGTFAIGETSIALYDQEGNMRNLGDVMADVTKATKDMTVEQRDAAVGAVFKERSIRGVNIMLATGTKRYDELSEAIHNSEGASAEAAAIMEDTMGGAMRQLKSQLEGVLIQLGEQLVPIIREQIIPLLVAFGERLSALIDWFSQLEEGTQRNILTGIALLAVLGPLLIVLGAIISVTGKVVGAFKAIKAVFVSTKAAAAATTGGLKALVIAKAVLFAKVIAVIAVIAALVAAIVWLVKNWDDVKASVVDFTKKALESVVAFGVEAIERFQEFGKNVLAFFVQLKDDAVESVITFGERAVEQFQEFGKNVRDFFVELRGRTVELVNLMRNSLIDRFKGIVTGIRNTLRGATEAITAPFRKAREKISGIVDTIKNSLNKINPFARSSPSLVDNVESGVKAILGQYKKLESLKVKMPVTGGLAQPALAGVTPAGTAGIASGHGLTGPLVMIQNMVVRNDEDINIISRQLHRHIQSSTRARGGK
ncbi:MAG: phage tail tape measure protein [Alkaliphilus sp.]